MIVAISAMPAIAAPAAADPAMTVAAVPGKGVRRHGRPVPRSRQGLCVDERHRSQPNAIKARIGAGSRRLLGPWRLNPESIAHPGAYALFGFSGEYSGLQSYCGLVMPYRAGSGRYRVSWRNIQVASKADVAAGRASPAQGARACADMLK